MKKKKPNADTQTYSIRLMLREKYGDPTRIAFFEEVGDSSGFAGSNWIDAIAFYLWPSDSHKRLAFEIKATRNDFLNELRNPKKREPFMKLCNEFWFVMPCGIAQVDEIPDRCGLMEATVSGLRVKKMARYNQDAEFTIGFASSLLRQKGKKASGLDKSLFKYAGKSITPEKLKEIVAKAKDAQFEQRIAWGVKHQRQDWLDQQPEAKLADAVRVAMGGSFLRPTVEDFKKFISNLTHGVPSEDVLSLLRSGEQFVRELKAIEEKAREARDVAKRT